MTSKDLSWSASFDSLEGLPTQGPPDRHIGRRFTTAIRRLAPGLLIVGLVALAASWLADHYGAPVMLFALLIGMAINFVGQDRRCRPGIDFASRVVLRVGVAFLGAQITMEQVASLGGPVLAIAAGGVLLTILVGWGVSRLLRLPADFGILTGGSVAICGASAALAIASVLPPSPTRERDTLLTVVSVTALSTVAMIVYPLLGAVLHLSPTRMGVFLGGTIHDVAQVVGAGYGVSKRVGDTATIVKLFRVAILLPTILVVSFVFSNRGPQHSGQRPPLVPLFLIGFATLVALHSTRMALVVTEPIGAASRWLLIVAIAALGAKTSLGELAKVGWRPLVAIVVETIFICVWVLLWV